VLMTFLIVCLPFLAGAQTSMVTGTVTSDTGETMPGVSIVIKGTTTGTTTDIDGRYSFSAPSDATLAFSFIGMVTKEVPVNGISVHDIILEADISQLDEVLVVGYGTTKEIDLTGSVSSVKAEELTAFPVAVASQALQGRAV